MTHLFTDDLMDLPFCVAELGPNFCVSTDETTNMQRLFRLIRAAEVADASAIKLQLKSFAPGGYYDKKDQDARPPWPSCPFPTMGAYYRAREPHTGTLNAIDAYCGIHGISWSASPWDVPSVELLGRYDTAWVKVASASITDERLLHAVRALGRHVILSTGMSTEADVDRAVEALGGTNITLLHCVSTYPAIASEVDLRVMRTLGTRHGLQTGWSSHARERDRAIAASAAAMGAVVLEAHLTHDVDFPWGPDHSSSLDPAGFHAFVRDCRMARRVALMGSGAKVVAPSEEAARKRLRG